MVFIIRASAAAYITTNIYENETIDHSNYESIQIYDSLDDPPKQTIVTFVTGSEASRIHSNDTSIVDIYDGTIWSIIIHESSTMNFYGGEINRVLNIFEESTLNVFGTNFLIVNGNNNDEPHASLSGTWENDNDFSFHFYRMSEIPDNVILHEIPEPASIILLGSGILLVKRKFIINCKKLLESEK